MATIATEAAPIYSESGRGEKKRLQLKKKLDDRRKKQNAPQQQKYRQGGRYYIYKQFLNT